VLSGAQDILFFWTLFQFSKHHIMLLLMNFWWIWNFTLLSHSFIDCIILNIR